MSPSKQQAYERMRRDIHAAIRENLFWYGRRLSRHEVVEVLASVLSAQIDIIKDDARNHRTD